MSVREVASGTGFLTLERDKRKKPFLLLLGVAMCACFLELWQPLCGHEEG